MTVFTRASDKPMTDGIPGLFTALGLRTMLLRSLPVATKQVAAESWVVGRNTDFAPAELQALEQAVTALYFADFTRRWDAMLADLNIAGITTLPQAAQALYILASTESPLRALLRSLGQQLQLPETGPSAATAARYAGLVALTAGDGAALEHSLRLVADIQQQLAKIAALPLGTPAPGGGEDIAVALQADTARQPQPLNRWLSVIAANAQALRTGNARRRIALAYNAPGGPAQVCAAALGHYPFAATGTPLDMDDFARVFGPGGALDGFLNTQLKPYLDMSAKPWKLLPASTAPAPLGAADVVQFQRATALRDAYFPGGQATPSVQIEITPIAAPRPTILTIGGTVIESGKGPSHATQIVWPLSGQPPGAAIGDANGASLVAEPGLALRETGPWALYRLFSRGRWQTTGKTRRQLLSFDAAPGTLSYDVTAPGAAFTPWLFGDFHCPTVQ